MKSLWHPGWQLFFIISFLIYFPTVKYSLHVLEVSSLNSKEQFLKASVLFLKEKIPENGEKNNLAPPLKRLKAATY